MISGHLICVNKNNISVLACPNGMLILEFHLEREKFENALLLSTFFHIYSLEFFIDTLFDYMLRFSFHNNPRTICNLPAPIFS